MAGYGRPLVSIVVCVWNVERYLSECLQSIQSQTYSNIEIIVVDDQSTDRSSETSRWFCWHESRAHYVWQRNRGPGPAGGRNGGIPYATGEWLLFIDSDDTIEPDMVERLVDATRHSGADVAVAGVDRFSHGEHRWESFLHHRTQGVGARTTSLFSSPELIWDSTAWNKLIRTSLWREVAGLFDEPHTYEDFFPITLVLLHARKIAVVPHFLYHWRAREDQTSVTQERTSLRGLNDKIDQIEKLLAALTRLGSLEIRQIFLQKLLMGDLKWLLNEYQQGDPEYRDAFRLGVGRLAQELDQEALEAAAVRERLALGALRDSDSDTFEMAATLSDDAGRLPLGRAEDGCLEVDLERLGLSKRLSSELARSDRATMTARLLELRVADSAIELRGLAAFSRIRALRSDQPTVTLRFTNSTTGAELLASSELGVRPSAHIGASGLVPQSLTEWRVTVPVEDFGDSGRWRVVARLEFSQGPHGESALRVPKWTQQASAEDGHVRLGLVDNEHACVIIDSDAPIRTWSLRDQARKKHVHRASRAIIRRLNQLLAP